MTNMHTSTTPMDSATAALIDAMCTAGGCPELHVKYTLSTQDGILFTLHMEDIPIFENMDCYEYDAYAHLPASVARIVDAVMWQVDEPLSFKFTVEL